MFNHISPTVIVGDYVYYYLTDPDTEYTASTNRTLVKADANTGEIVAKSAEFAGGGSCCPRLPPEREDLHLWLGNGRQSNLCL